MLKHRLPTFALVRTLRTRRSAGSAHRSSRLTPREPRRKVMIKARVRASASWNDVCILDISSRGLSMKAAVPPPRGTYLDIRRGTHEIMACVVWATDQRFGVHTQDMLDVDSIIDHPNQCAAEPDGEIARNPKFDRRLSRRPTSERLEESRMLSRAMEFLVIGIFAASAAVVTFSSVAEALRRPLAEASAALGR